MLNKILEKKIVNIIYKPIDFNTCFGSSKEPSLLQMVLLSTHNNYFGSEIKKTHVQLHTLLYLKVCHWVSLSITEILEDRKKSILIRLA